MLADPATASTPPAGAYSTSARPSKRRNRSVARITKLCGVHGSSQAGRQFRRIVTELVAELGGEPALGPQGRLQVRQAATLALALEQMQAAVAKGEAVDMEDFVRTGNSLTRVLKGLGIKKQAAQPTGLAAYLAATKDQPA
ncbi:hypothetical protein SAMN05519103_04556 [Rhizobiales bacterium GAS113]|nr:hypothetical protein SAMN05519103_04556 [Rhizobiales bacterium GAS113]